MPAPACSATSSYTRNTRPSTSADVDRRHRWIRGDWQVALWLLPWAPGPDGQRHRNAISALSRWKLFDNLRRSLAPAALTLLLLLGWTAFSSTWFWTLVVLCIFLIPAALATLLDILRKPSEMRTGQHLAAAAYSAGQRLIQAGFASETLPHEADHTLDAILRTLARLLVTRKRLLEWNPSSNREQSSRTDLAASLRSMWFAPLLATGTALYLAGFTPAMLIQAGSDPQPPWLASPALAPCAISLPLARPEVRLSAEQTRFLGRIARKTWAFFETFVGPDDHWLPPDNYQEYRAATLAHRTSPTNMGLALLANLSAYDFGYIPGGQLVDRTSDTLETMARLPSYRGHFYNWYDTQSLQALHPAYVSTVDSGNLAGHLLTLRSGLIALLDRPNPGTPVAGRLGR